MNVFDIIWASYTALWLVVLLNTVFLIVTLRAIGRLLMRMPAVGALALEDQGPDYGQVVSLPNGLMDGVKDTSILLVFLSTSCILCRKIAPTIGAIRRRDLTRLIVIKGEQHKADQLISLMSPDEHMRTLVDGDVFEELGVDATPFVMLLDSARKVVAKGTVNTLEQLESMVEARRGGHA